MSELNLIPDLLRRLRKAESDIYELQRRQLPGGTALKAKSIPDLAFSYPGLVADAMPSPRYYPGVALTLVGVIGSVRALGTGNVTVDLAINGAVFHTTVIVSPALVQADTVLTDLGAGDYLTCATVTAHGASDLAIDFQIGQ